MASGVNSPVEHEGNDENAEVPERARTALQTNSKSLMQTLRVYAASSGEADIAKVAERCERFIRAVEGATCDGAVIATTVSLDGLPAGTTDRFYAAMEKFHDNDALTLGLIDIKTFQWHAQYTEYSTINLPHKFFTAMVPVSSAQLAACEAIVVGSIADPDWVAFVPKAYFRKLKGHDQSQTYLYYGLTHPMTGHLNPLPPSLAPFVMHRQTHLPEALQNLADRIADPAVEL